MVRDLRGSQPSLSLQLNANFTRLIKTGHSETHQQLNSSAVDLQYKAYPLPNSLSFACGKDEDEVPFEDVKFDVRSSSTSRKPGFRKLEMACQVMWEKHNLQYAWIDSGCAI